jgi:ubiquinone/menaquinone biosynthesis C-methylase UbiE
MRYLTHQQARHFYDHFGIKQDTQSFYEDKAIDVLIQDADFPHAQYVLEFGCGTGRLAQRLLAENLPATAIYQGLDISTTMVQLATQRLQAFASRARVNQTQGEMHLAFPEQTFDRFVSAYVLDLLPGKEIRELLGEAYRVLNDSGILAVVSLSQGETIIGKGVTGLWRLIHRINPKLVGGCRPVELDDFIDNRLWKVTHHEKVSQFGVTSEVIIADKIAKNPP